MNAERFAFKQRQTNYYRIATIVFNNIIIHHACSLGSPHTLRYGRQQYIKHICDAVIGLLTAMFGAAGTLVNLSQRAQNLGKVRLNRVFENDLWLCFFQPPRYGIDNWDTMMMNRDKQLTGHQRGQSVSEGSCWLTSFSLTFYYQVKSGCTIRVLD